MKKLLSAFLILISFLSRAQVTDDFSDGDFTANPAWTGDAAQFKVNTAFELQLNSTGDNISSLATACTMADSMEWNIKVKLSFSPSDNNNARIYLVSDQPDLKSNALNGYYLKLGETGSNDAIELFRQAGNISTSLCRGTAGLLANAFTVRIRVIRDNYGKWSIYADPAGGNAYQPEATATDNTFTTTSWFGVYCKYTSSNSTKFYFDDVYAGEVIVDKTPPTLLTANVLSANTIDLHFSESLDQASAEKATNYSVDQAIGNPSIAVRDAQDFSLIHLLFDTDFTPDVAYILSADGIKDLAGNVMQNAQIAVGWHQVKQFDVLINEIMADPNPVVGLPDEEYIEIFNRRNFDIDLENWTLTLGSSVKTFPSYSLPAGDYLIIGSAAAQPALSAYGPCLGFSSFSVVNTGTTITLTDAGGRMIHSVTFTDDWYGSDYKKDGGWSLEQIDPLNPCGDAANWTASNDASGGTPGRINNAGASNPDYTLPEILRVGVDTPYQIPVWFSESMDSTTISNPANYNIDNGIGNPAAVLLTGPDYRKVVMILANPIVQGTVYTLTLSGSFSDCAGNVISSSATARFAIPSVARPDDIVINEVLYNPAPGCVDFVEILNRTTDVFDLQWLILATCDTATLILSDESNLSSESRLILPGDYLVLTTDTAAVKAFYITTNPAGFVQVDDLPSMNDDEGAIALALKTGLVIDRFAYNDKMQYPLLTNAEGVSLERINPNLPWDQVSNWHSASQTAGFATPAYQNSQFGIVDNSGNEILLSPDIISPDNDGKDDYLTIAYAFDEPGYNARVTIYDATGRQVRKLVNNELCGISGAFTWDGITDDNTKAAIGRYVVYIEIFDLQGDVKRFKKTTVVAGKL
ncbi:MAG TPA: lamin tail domain-containing protein [Bacteroidales bacterium]|nr:lamin tail domain-containing protein [Bacteroidales bacterium]